MSARLRRDRRGCAAGRCSACFRTRPRTWCRPARAALRGRPVCCLYPHQTAYVVPAGAVAVVPEGVPPARAVLAGTVETAVNALWDAGPLLGDRVAVVGAGMVGCCVARVLRGFPEVEVSLVDID